MALYQYLRPTTTPAVEVTGTSTKTPAPDTAVKLKVEKEASIRSLVKRKSLSLGGIPVNTG